MHPPCFSLSAHSLALFLKDNGTVNDHMGGDAVHINGNGQKIWMNAMKPAGFHQR